MLCAFAVLLTGGVWLALGVHKQDQITKAVACVWKVSYALLLLGLTVFTGAMWIHYKSYTAGLFFAVFFGSSSGMAIGLFVLFLKARLAPSLPPEKVSSFDCENSHEEKRPSTYRDV